MAFTRREILARLRRQVQAGKPIVGCGAGTGISAKFAAAGGADLIIIYNSGRYRMAGRGSLAGLLAYGDANAIVTEMAAEVLPVVTNTPVLAGINGTDPFRLMPVFLRQLAGIGFSGVQNFPTVGLIDGTFRANLEATGMGYDKEVAAIGAAHELDLFTAPYVFDAEQAAAMAAAGADMLVAHVGLTTAGSIGAAVALTLDQAVQRVLTIAGAGPQGTRGHPGDLPRRPVRRTRHSRQGPGHAARHRRILRRLQHRTTAHRTRDPRPGGKLQEPQARDIAARNAGPGVTPGIPYRTGRPQRIARPSPASGRTTATDLHFPARIGRRRPLLAACSLAHQAQRVRRAGPDPDQEGDAGVKVQGRPASGQWGDQPEAGLCAMPAHPDHTSASAGAAGTARPAPAGPSPGTGPRRWSAGPGRDPTTQA